MKVILFIISFYPTIIVSQQTIFYASEMGSRGRDIYSLTIESGEQKKLTRSLGSSHYPHYNNPKLSPDGTTLVFQSDPDGHDRYTIWTMKANGTGLQKITQNEGLYPNWSPDGKTIVFSGRRNGVWEILTIPANGGMERIISNNKQNGKRPIWGATCSFHPDDKSIIYSYIREKILYTLDLESGESVQLFKSGSYTHPVYADDGSILVNRKISEGYDLVHIKGENESVIAKSVVSYSAPDWYANDSKILFVGMINDNQELFMVDLITREEKQITTNTFFDAMPVAK